MACRFMSGKKMMNLMTMSMGETWIAHDEWMKKMMSKMGIFLKEGEGVKLCERKGVKFEYKKRSLSGGEWRRIRRVRGCRRRVRRNKGDGIYFNHKKIKIIVKKEQSVEESIRKLLINYEKFRLECAKRVVESAKKNLKDLQILFKKINTEISSNNERKMIPKNRENEFFEHKDHHLKGLYSKLKFKMISIFKRNSLDQIDISLKKGSFEEIDRSVENSMNTINTMDLPLNIYETLEEKDNIIDHEESSSATNVEKKTLKTIEVKDNNILYFNENKLINTQFKKHNYHSSEKENLMIDVLEEIDTVHNTEIPSKIDLATQKRKDIKNENENSPEIQDTNALGLKSITKFYEEPATINDNDNFEETCAIYDISNQLILQLQNSTFFDVPQISLPGSLSHNIYEKDTLLSFMKNKLSCITLSQSDMLLLGHKHSNSTEQGLNCSIIEIVNASIKNNEPIELKIQGEVAFSYTKKTISEDFFFKLAIQITSFENFSKMSFNKNILENISSNPSQYLLDLRHLSQMIPVLRYEIIVNVNKTIFQPILITSQWKHIQGESTLVITYKKNPYFLHSDSTLALQDLSFIVGPENVLIKTCQSKPEGTFYKKQNKLVFSLGNKILHDEKEETLLARFETSGIASFNSSINVIWKVSFKNPNIINNGVVITASNPFLSFNSSLNFPENTACNFSTSYPLFITRVIQSGIYTVF